MGVTLKLFTTFIVVAAILAFPKTGLLSGVIVPVHSAIALKGSSEAVTPIKRSSQCRHRKHRNAV